MEGRENLAPREKRKEKKKRRRKRARLGKNIEERKKERMALPT